MFGLKEVKVAAPERFQIYVALHKREAASPCLLQTSGTDASGLRGLAGQQMFPTFFCTLFICTFQTYLLSSVFHTDKTHLIPTLKIII